MADPTPPTRPRTRLDPVVPAERAGRHGAVVPAELARRRAPVEPVVRTPWGVRLEGVPRPERPLRSERGLFDSGPRYLLIVLLLAVATSGPSVAVAVAGRAALAGTNGPATTPLVAAAPVPGSVLIPVVEASAPPLEPLSMVQRERPAADPSVPPPGSRSRWLFAD